MLSQVIEINDPGDLESFFSLQQLVEDVLIDSECTEVDTFSEQVSGGPNLNQNKSYGYFERPLGSRFPFERGIVLTTGQAFPAGNTLNPNLISSDNGLAGDLDLEAALGITGTNDATFVKFNFVPTIDEISFRFLMASEEYDGATECDFADSFAFLLREVGTTTYRNLAILPDGTPVSVTNINDAAGCRANEDFFDGYNIGATNYGGRTTVLTAMANVIPNTTYEIKLVVADQGDSIWDSAIFLEAGSFNIGLNLGPDLTIATNNAACTNNITELDTGFVGFTHTWFLDGVLIAGETDSILNITTDGTYTVVVEFADNCQATDDIIVEFSQGPILNPINDQFICDTDNDGFWALDFDILNDIVLGTQDAAEFTVTFHPSLMDAEDNTNAITFPYTNQIAYQQEEVFIRIENSNTPYCFETDSFLFDVFNSATAAPAVYELCDNDLDGDDTNGFVEFDLSTINTQVLGTQNPTLFNVSYHLNQSDADADLSPLPFLFTNTVANGQTIVARVENIDNPQECFSTSEIDLIVNPLPVVTSSVVLEQCDDDTDGITLFNLTEANSLISVDFATETFTYYLTQAEADTGLIADQITAVTAYPNPTPVTSTVFARVETANGCWRTAQVDLLVGATQIPAAFNITYNVCDDVLIDGDNTNGIAAFDFSDATAQIEALFPVGQDISISYYIDLNDALSETNAIPDITNHRNEASPNTQSIFVRIDNNTLNACLGLGEHITLVVDPLPITNIITPYVLCSDNDEAIFDLFTKDAEVIGAQTQDILISYHTTLLDAENNVNPIVNPYTNISNPQTIFVRAQFDDNGNGIGDAGECISTDMSFELQVIPNPVLNNPDPIRICNDQVETIYDLTIREDQITNSDISITLEYFASQVDLDNDNAIANPNTFTSLTFTNQVLVRATGANGCTTTIPLDLLTILFDPINTTPDAIEECEVDDDGFDNFDLARRENQILNGLDSTDFTFLYYELEADAILGNANNISNPNDFINTIPINQTIYARVQPVANECFQIVPINLIVNRVPEIQIEEQYALCLDNQDNVLDPGTETLLTILPIDTQLNATDYSFEWYTGDTALPENIIVGENGPTYNPIVAGDFTVIATNLITGCTIPATTTVIGSYPPESIVVEIITSSFSENNTIEVTVTGSGEYEYNIDGGEWQSSNIFANLMGGDHIVGVRDIVNCGILTETITVIDYPKFFTPNDDGYNDTWNIKGLSNQPNSKIYIFDRYGKLLKQINAAGNGWDGRFNGELLPSNDYWFTVEFIEPSSLIKRQFRAHFTLKR